MSSVCQFMQFCFGAEGVQSFAGSSSSMAEPVDESAKFWRASAPKTVDLIETVSTWIGAPCREAQDTCI